MNDNTTQTKLKNNGKVTTITGGNRTSSGGPQIGSKRIAHVQYGASGTEDRDIRISR